MEDKCLIHIPKDGGYIEILGHRIDGFESFDAFCEHLKKFTEDVIICDYLNELHKSVTSQAFCRPRYCGGFIKKRKGGEG